MKRVVLLAVFGLVFVIGANAQKFGHVYSKQILDSLSAYKDAEKKVQIIVDEGTKELEDMQKLLEAEYRDLEMARDTMDEFMYQRKARDLQMSYQRLQEKQQLLEQDVQTMQIRHIEPVLKNLQKAIKVVGDREKFTYIFEATETSPGIPVYVGGGSDITKMVEEEIKSYYK